MRILTRLYTPQKRAPVGCGGDEGDGGDPEVDAGGGEVTCTVTATATPDADEQTITGLGLVECSGPTTIGIETCVQWDSSGSFEDIMCASSTESGVEELEVENESSCGFGSGHSYRARVNATVEGADQGETLSDEVSCE